MDRASRAANKCFGFYVPQPNVDKRGLDVEIRQTDIWACVQLANTEMPPFLSAEQCNYAHVVICGSCNDCFRPDLQSSDDWKEVFQATDKGVSNTEKEIIMNLKVIASTASYYYWKHCSLIYHRVDKLQG